MERIGDPVDCGLRCSRVKRTLASHEGGRIKIAENDIGIGDRGRESAIAITSRARHGARTFRTYSQRSTTVDTRDGSSTRRDTGNVQAAQSDALPGEHSICGKPRAALRNNGNIRARTAHVE